MDYSSASIRFRHPTQELAFITEVLDLPTFRTWKVGAPRETLTGSPLIGTYRDSFWTGEIRFEPSSGFAGPLANAVERVARVEATVRELASTGGTVEIYLQLAGWINNGDSIDASLLRTMSDLGITLSIEVFPN